MALHAEIKPIVEDEWLGFKSQYNKYFITIRICNENFDPA